MVSDKGMNEHTNKKVKTNHGNAIDLLQEVGLRKSLLANDFLSDFDSAGSAHSSHRKSMVVSDFPFRSAFIPGVFEPEFLKNVRQEVLSGQLPFHLKSNDLYHFYQSDSIVHTRLPYLSKLRDAIYSKEFVRCMQTMTGLKLSETIDLSAHRYPHNGYLLCHDDDIGSDADARVIAFIIYLVEEDWNMRSDEVADGGRLQLFDCDSQGQPGNIVASMIPRFNSFAYFHVTPTSYHEVEMIHGGRDRVSISGWFHGPKPHTASPRIDDALSDAMSTTLKEWIHPAYLDEKNLEAIHVAFSEESFVEMRAFLQAEKYTQLLEAWKLVNQLQVGPANRRNYYIPLLSSDSSVFQAHTNVNTQEAVFTPALLSATRFLSQFKHFMESDAMRSFLATVTRLDRLNSSWCEYRRFRPMNYTLIHDHVQQPIGLDVVFSCCDFDPSAVEWNEGWGGLLQYIADKETLLSIPPSFNSLHLVYRTDSDTKYFVQRLAGDCPYDRYDLISTLADSSL